MFPRRQLWRPALEYPLWDYNWDGRQPTPIGRVDVEEGGDDSRLMAEARRERLIRKEGVTRHIILVRHGQYDETYKVRRIQMRERTTFIARIIPSVSSVKRERARNLGRDRKIQDASSRRSGGSRPN